MATVQLHDITVVLFSRQLKNLLAVLDKSEQWCKDQGRPETYLTEARLAPDMGDLTFQIKNAVAMAKNGLLAPDYEYLLPQFVQEYPRDLGGMKQSVQAVIDIVDGRPPSADTSLGDREYGHRVNGVETFKCKNAANLLANIVFPNFWFHMVTAYDICRHQGVPLGKADYLMSAGAW